MMHHPKQEEIQRFQVSNFLRDFDDNSIYGSNWFFERVKYES